MITIHSFLSTDHRHCDQTLANLEVAASKSQWDAAHLLTAQLTKEMNHHFNCEETILFPAFEDKTGMTQGPTMVMRMEHEQIHEMLEDLSLAVAEKNSDRTLGITDTLMTYIQQHNGKEEQMLYNMCDMHLREQAEGLITQMRNLE